MTQSARHRARPQITLFENGMVPSLEEAQIDRIDIRFQGGQIACASLEAQRAFVNALCMGDRFAIGHRRAGHDFKTAGSLIPSMLFKIGRPRQTAPYLDQGWLQAPLVTDLKVSLARLLAHYPEVGDAPSSVPQSFPFLREDVDVLLRRGSLAGFNNYLPREQWLRSRPFFEKQINALRAVLNDTTARFLLAAQGEWSAPALSGPFVQRVAQDAAWSGAEVYVELPWEDWVLSHCEVCWDFRCADAITLIHHLRPVMFAASSDTEVIDYGLPEPINLRPPERGRWRQIRNAVSVAVRVNRSVSIVAYAKARDRIRFEVRYDRNVRQIFPRDASGAQMPPDLAGLEAMLYFLRDDAHRRLTRLLGGLPIYGFREDNPLRHLAQFLGAISLATNGTESKLQKLLQILLFHQGITPTGDEAEDVPIEVLLELGVLHRARTSMRDTQPRYILSEPYRTLLTSMVRCTEPRLHR